MMAKSTPGKGAHALARLPQRMADGGEVSPYSLKGMARSLSGAAGALASNFTSPAGYTPARASAPAPAPAPAPAMTRLGGVNTGVIARREAAAGMANGGAVEDLDDHGGEVDDPDGMPTSDVADPDKDTVETVLQPGEIVFPVDSVKAIGKDKLLAMIAETHTPTGDDGEQDGMLAKADGGLIPDDRQRRVAQIPTGGYPAVAPGQSASGSELGRNVVNTLSAIPGMGSIPGVGQAAAGVAKVAMGGGVAVAPAVGAVAPYAPVAAGAGAAAVAAAPPNVERPAPIPTAPVASVAPAGALPPGTQPGTAGAGRGALNPRSAQEEALATVPMLGGQRGTAVQGAPGVSRFQTSDNRTLYSNVVGADNDVLMSNKPGIQTAPGAAASGAPAGATAQLSSGTSEALSAARSQALARGDIEAVRASYGGNFNDGSTPQPTAQQALAAQIARDVAGGKRITARGAAVVEASARAENEARRDTANSGNAAARLALDARTHGQDAELKGMQVKAAQQLQQAQQAFIGAKTPADKEAATETLRALQGKYEKEFPELFATTALPGQVDAMGNKTPGGAIVTNKRTGDTRIIYGSETTGGQPQALPAKDQLKTGVTYTTPRGPAKWDGKQFIPA